MLVIKCDIFVVSGIGITFWLSKSVFPNFCITPTPILSLKTRYYTHRYLMRNIHMMKQTSNTQLKIWGRRNSSNVQKVMWLVGELHLMHEHISVGGKFGGLDTPEFLAMNPHGRIPVISDNGNIVWESHAILRYLAACYNNAHFWSDDPKARSQIEPWMDWLQTTLQPDFLNGIFWGYYRTPEAQRNWPAIHASIERCSKHFQLLDNILKFKTFLCGDYITLADITIGTMLYRYFELDIERPTIPNVEMWYKRLQERSAYREHVMVPFNDMKGRLTF